MVTQCNKCQSSNRHIAKYCKRCGVSMAPSRKENPLDLLVGLEDIKKTLEDRVKVIARMREANTLIKMNYHTLLVGNSGTAKTLIANILFDTLAQWEMVTQKSPVYKNAPDFSSMAMADIEDLFTKAKGGVIIVDNAQDLVKSDGQMEQGLKKLLGELDRHGPDPIVILCGLPYGLREFLQREQNTHITGRFRDILFIDDYSSPTLSQIIEAELCRNLGFTFSREASDRLSLRCKYLAKESKQPQSILTAKNGYLAKQEAENIIKAYFLQGGAQKQISPESIVGKVEEPKSIEQIMAKLDSFVGMKEIKEAIRSLHAQLLLAKRRTAAQQQAGNPSTAAAKPDFNLHAVITGNPGTGKTTVVRILGEIYAALGVVDTGHVVEVDRSKLVAGFKGQTAIQTNRMCDSALGGVLFVDEAYALKQGDTDDFGQEAIDTLMKRVEDDRGKFVCIAAGYKEEMFHFMQSNPGMESRFPNRYHLEDYTADELLEIFRRSVKAGHYTLTPEAQSRAASYLEALVARKTKSFANGREARNLLDKVKKQMTERLSQSWQSSSNDANANALSLILPEDIPSGGAADGGVSPEKALANLEGFIGLGEVKRKVRDLIDSLEVQKLRGRQRPLGAHFVFLGNPGTGKTSVARVLADIFFAIGLLPTANLVEVERSKLVSGGADGTAALVNKVCERAMGGLLFIDEAYTLIKGKYDSSGQEAVDALLKRMEDDRGKFVVIAAGYRDEMHTFMGSNPGLKNRFTNIIEFEDYTPDEMVRIYKKFAQEEGVDLEEGLDDLLLRHFKMIDARKTATFANARTARNEWNKTLERLSGRVMALKAAGADLDTLKAEGNRVRPEDLPTEGEGKKVTVEEAMAKLHRTVGLNGVKRKVEELCQSLEVQRLRGREKPINSHLVFTGNPGTGKTSVARILADVFCAIGLLPTNTLVEADRSTLVGETVGSTAPKVQEMCEKAMGGVLFIDEAYTLAPSKRGMSNDFGQEAIDTLLKRMEDDGGKFVVIVAGYNREMESFINSNSGLKSRFSSFIEFEDYNGPEMTRIFELFANGDGYTVSPEARTELERIFNHLYANRDGNFGNARTVRQLFNTAEARLSARVIGMKRQGVAPDTIRQAANTILPQDLQPGDHQ